MAQDACPAGPGPIKDDRWGLSFAASGGKGARVADIDPGSPAAWLLRAGDVVLSADRKPIHEAGEIACYLAGVADGVPVLLELRRGGGVRFVGIQIPGKPAPAPAPTSVFPAGVGEPPPAPPAPPMIVIQPQAPASPVTINPEYASGGWLEPGYPYMGWVEGGGSWWPRPPSFSAPGRPEIPGATFPPEAGAPPQAYPQLPGVLQPPSFRVPLAPRPPGVSPPESPGEPAQLPPAPPPPGQRPGPGVVGAPGPIGVPPAAPAPVIPRGAMPHGVGPR